MEAAVQDVLTADDPLYDELYDVTNEAMAIGNWVDVNSIMPRLQELRAVAPVYKGRVRELLGLPHHAGIFSRATGSTILR